MASLRTMRRSRRASPMIISAPESMTVEDEMQPDVNEDMSEDWTEPPLRTPAPSFEDYKGLERHGVLEHMAPLGSLPSSKVKARLKQHQPPRRAALLKNGELKASMEEVHDPEPPPVAPRRSEPRKIDDRVATVPSPREKDEDHDYTPTNKGAAKVVSAKAATLPTTLNGTPSSRTAQGRLKLKQIVDSAVRRSDELGDPVLGDAVKDLYDESLRNPAVADLLDAVLTKKPSPQQTADFQSRIKAARRKHRDKRPSQDRVSKVASISPVTKSTRSSVARHLSISKVASPLPVTSNNCLDSNSPSPKQIHSAVDTNGSPTNEERPSKRVKRSHSASSDSSLSSLDSTIDQEPPPTLECNHATDRKASQSRTETPNGPRLGTFPIRSTDPRRPILLSINSNPLDEVAVKKREEMRQKFNQFVGTKESAIRSSPSPAYSPQPTSPVSALAERNQQARVRSKTRQRRGKDDYESLYSPASSNFGELLIPPPPGASRSATPNQLARPPKGFKKAARIKISPMKKRTITTAGRGAEGESGTGSNGRTTNTHSDGNSENCTACSGNGLLLCCEGCTRAFHLTCCEPPVEQDPAGDWYCSKCSEARSPQPLTDRGVMRYAIAESLKQNPLSFALPPKIRSHFEGVITGEDCEYEEASAAKGPKTRGGYEEPPNNFRVKDGKDNPIFCFRCKGSSMPIRQSDGVTAMGSLSRGGREMIQCDYCSHSWHLECLDPPLAVAPKKTKGDGIKVLWMCPNHVDSELLSIDPNANISNRDRPTLGRKYKIRRPKVLKVIEPGLTRGFRNNGIIEIENESSEGEVPRLQEKGIKLDFIDRVKRARTEAELRAGIERARRKARRQSAFDKRSFAERKAALNMVQMAHAPGASISPDKVQNLIGTLIAEAPDDVEQLVDVAEKEPTVEERRDLEALIEMARRRLAGGMAD